VEVETTVSVTFTLAGDEPSGSFPSFGHGHLFAMMAERTSILSQWEEERGTSEPGKVQGGNTQDPDLQAGSGETVACQLESGAPGGSRHCKGDYCRPAGALNFDEQEKIQADLLDEVFGLARWSPC